MTDEESVYPVPVTNDPTLQDALLAGLAASANDLRAVANGLYRSALLSRLEKVIASVILLASFAGTIISLFVLISLHGIASTNRDNNGITRQNTATIKDCTDPTGKCYQENASHTALLIAQLEAATFVAVECADQYDGRAAIDTCITTRLHH